ncbi:MAG: type II toxin-antitoxin system MqsA family antitoxin [Bacilli bacterium]|nr:type II toxin-antitoxin system MqsA family antitoxin [Bacilli bacterium]
MEKEKCVICGGNEFEVKTIDKAFDVRGDKFNINVEIRICKKCHEQYFSDEESTRIEKELFDLYKKKNHLLTSKEIIEIRAKRNLSQVDFARSLGFGDKTVARYETGSIQDRAYDILMRLADSNVGYRFILNPKYGLDYFINQEKKSSINKNEASWDITCKKHTNGEIGCQMKTSLA